MLCCCRLAPRGAWHYASRTLHLQVLFSMPVCWLGAPPCELHTGIQHCCISAVMYRSHGPRGRAGSCLLWTRAASDQHIRGAPDQRIRDAPIQRTTWTLRCSHGATSVVPRGPFLRPCHSAHPSAHCAGAPSLPGEHSALDLHLLLPSGPRVRH